MEKEFYSGESHLYTKAISKTTKRMGGDDCLLIMVIFTLDSGKTIKLMDLVNTHVKEEAHMLVIGSQIYNMARAKRLGQIMTVS